MDKAGKYLFDIQHAISLIEQFIIRKNLPILKEEVEALLWKYAFKSALVRE